jgi:hypothetical protein
VGSRNGLVLQVGQAWRIYPAYVDIRGAGNLVELLKRFADVFGAPVEWEGKRGNFFLSVGSPLPSNFTYKMPNSKKGTNIGISQVTQLRWGKPIAAFVVCVDLIKYNDLLTRMQISKDDIRNIGTQPSSSMS